MKNIAKLAFKAFSSNFAELPLPYKLTMVLTNRCNNRCKTCNIWQNHKIPDSRLEDIEKFFRKSDFFSWISLTGGEIFLRDDIYAISRIIKKNVKDICFLTFPTNGYLTDKIVSDVERILSLNFNKVVVSVSLDGPPRLHDNLRGIDGAWAKSMDTFINLKRIKNSKLTVNFGFTVSNYNMRFIGETVESIKEMYPEFSLKDMHLNMAFNAERYSNLENKDILCADKQGLLSKLTLYQKNKRLPEIISFIDCLHVKLLKKYIKTGKTPLPCLSLASSCLVDLDWSVQPCFNFSVKIGNLKDADFDLKKLWSTKHRKCLRNEIRNYNCPQCWTPCESFQTILGNMRKAIFS